MLKSEKRRELYLELLNLIDLWDNNNKTEFEYGFQKQNLLDFIQYNYKIGLLTWMEAEWLRDPIKDTYKGHVSLAVTEFKKQLCTIFDRYFDYHN